MNEESGTAGTVKVLAVLLCDDIRREAETNFEFLIGVVGIGSYINTRPDDEIRAALYVLYKVLVAGSVNLDFQITGTALGKPVLVEGVLATEMPKYPDEMFPITLKLAFHVVRTGNIEIQSRQNDGPWETVRVIRAKVRDTLAPITPTR